MYINFALNLYMTLSSADNTFQTIWTQIRPDILSRLDKGQTVWHFRGYDMLKLNRCILILR